MHEKSRATSAFMRSLHQYLFDINRMNELLPSLRQKHQGKWVVVYKGQLRVVTADAEAMYDYKALHDEWPVAVFIHPKFRS